MSESDDASPWGFLGLAGLLSICCVGTAVLAGGVALTGAAALAGGSAAGATAVGGTVRGFGGILVTGLATALPLFVIGIVLRRRAQHG